MNKPFRIEDIKQAAAEPKRGDRNYVRADMRRLSLGLNAGGGFTWCHILREESLHRVKTVTIANQYLSWHGVNRWEKTRALRRMEKAGLISVERRLRKSPIVTILI